MFVSAGDTVTILGSNVVCSVVCVSQFSNVGVLYYVIENGTNVHHYLSADEFKKC